MNIELEPLSVQNAYLASKANKASTGSLKQLLSCRDGSWELGVGKYFISYYLSIVYKTPNSKLL
jgi:hypothetical protein